MSSLSWKIRQFASNLVPLLVIGGIAYGGWHFYKKGTFRHGIAPAVSSVLRQIPYFGSRFRHYTSGSSYASSPKSYRKKHGNHKRGKKHLRRSPRRRR